MRIEQSHVDYSAREAYTERRERRDHLRVELRVPSPAPVAWIEDAFSGDGDPRLSLARLVVERLLGGRFHRSRPVLRRMQTPPPATAGWSVTFSHTEVYEEKESLVVKARGAVRTTQGDEIHFNAEFTLSRRFVEESGFTLRAGNANLSDPLFLETAGGQALLVDDGDANGEVSGAAELFGARSGDGFAELARLDADSNGWIDAGDPAFARLRLRLDSSALQSLESAGVGALSTRGIDGRFQFKDEANELTAVVRRTGVYLTEDGQAGALRQIDLAL
jgi:hypothetical protein